MSPAIRDSDWVTMQRRVQDLERRMSAAAVAVPNRQGSALGTQRPPPVAGLVAAPAPGQIGAMWTSTPIADLETYEVEVSTTPAFSGSVTAIATRETRFTLTVDDPGAQHYVRVRARSQSTGAGPWSNVLSTQTGLIVSASLSPDATSAVTRIVQESFEPALMSNTAEENQAIYADIPVFAQGGVVLLFAQLRATYSQSNTPGDPGWWSMEADLLRDGVPLSHPQNLQEYFVTTTPTNNEGVYTMQGGINTVDEPGVGIFTYAIRLRMRRSIPFNVFTFLEPRYAEIVAVEMMRGRLG